MMDQENLFIKNKILEAKTFSLDFFFPNYYCDICDESKIWRVGEILERYDEYITVHYDGYPSKYDEKVSINKTKKVNYFRRFTKGYTGFENVTFRRNTASLEVFTNLKLTIRNLIDTKFMCESPYELIQLLRGKVFTEIDAMMTSILSITELPSMVPLMMEILLDCLGMIVEYLKIFSENINLISVLYKNRDLYLVDVAFALLSSLPEMIITLKRLFGHDPRVSEFYKTYDDSIKKFYKPLMSNNSSRKKICTEIAYKMNSIIEYNGVKQPTVILAYLIDYFYEKGGIDLCLRIILDNPFLHLEVIESLLLPITLIQAMVKDTKASFIQEVQSLKDYFRTRINNLTESEIKELKKSNIISFITCMTSIQPIDKDSKQILLEDLYLNFLFKCLTIKNLEKRIFAMNSFNLIIDTLGYNESPAKDRDENNQPEVDPNIKQLTFKGFLSFLQEKGIIDVLLGETIHEELLKRACPMFVMLAKCNWGQFQTEEPSMFNTRQIYDNLWRLYVEKHESLSMQIDSIICELSFAINEQDRIYLFAKIKSYTDSWISNVSTSVTEPNSNVKAMMRIINLINNFTQNCFRKNNYIFPDDETLDIFSDTRMFGLPLLWNYMQDDFNIYNSNDYIHQRGLEIINMCKNSIKGLMDLSTVDGQIKIQVLFLCFDNVKKNSSVVQSLSLFKKIINDSYRGVKGKRVLNCLNDSFGGLVNCIIEDLERYISKVKATIQESMHVIDQRRNNLTTIFEGYYNHETNIRTRLDIIYFLTGCSNTARNMTLQKEQVQRLWNLLSINAESCESDILYETLNSNIADLENEVIEYLFRDILASRDQLCIKKVNKKSLALFQTYFFDMNEKYDNFIQDNKTYRIQSEDILGIDTLWGMLVEIQDDDTQREVSELLGKLCLDLKSFTEEFCIQYWTLFMEKLLVTLTTCFSNHIEKGIQGVIMLIKYILTNTGPSGIIPEKDDCNWPETNWVHYTFSCPERGDKKYAIRVTETDFSYHVRWRVAYFYDIQVNLVKMTYGKTSIDLNSDFRIFRGIFNPDYVIEVKEKKHPIFSLSVNPRTLIYNDKRLIKILFELLHDSDKTFIQDLWELINTLPKNADLENEIADLGKSVIASVDWKNYFDDKSIYVVSYTLKTIKRFIFLETAEESSSRSYNVEWISNFNKNKGGCAIVNLIFQLKLEHFMLRSNLGFECLNDMLAILKPILLLSYSIPVSPVKGKPESTPGISITTTFKLVQKVIELIQLIIAASIEKDHDPHLQKVQEEYSKKRNRKLQESDSNHSSDDDEDNSTSGLVNENCDEYEKIWREENKSIESLIHFIDILNQKDIFLQLLLSENYTEMKYIFTTGIICGKNKNYKIILRNFVNASLYSHHVEDQLKLKFKSSLFEILLGISTITMAKENKETSGAFFTIVALLMNNHLNCNQMNSIDFLKLADFLADYVQTLSVSTFLSRSSDQVLEGHLRILRILILKSNEIAESLMRKYDLINLVLNKCLFSKCVPNPLIQHFPICQTASSRQSAFQLMSAITYNNPDILTKIMSILNELHVLGFWKSHRLIDWRLSLACDEKSSTGFVGLKNLGCTCYINSLLQQFFMIPQLRETLLLSTDNSDSPQDASTLFQLKYILASLKAYESQYYNPKDFCLNFDGNVLDIREQMDADEFLNTLIDKLENHLKESPFQAIFKHCFGGKISDELIFKGCPHISENQVYFQTIQLQVINKKSISESLQSFIEGEMMEGDNAIHCEKCDKKFPALKRQSFKSLPRILIIVLKRFEFDYDEMVKIKVNDYCEFPMELDMEPYTQEYLKKNECKPGDEVKNDLEYPMEQKKENYLYSLTGVLIHTGTSEAGHYYSIIKDIENGSWYEFNDTIVKDYDILDLKRDAFGVKQDQGHSRDKKESIDKSSNANAYLLFYRQNVETSEDNCITLTTNVSPKAHCCPLATQWSRFSNISDELMNRINQDNFQYWVQKTIFSTEYHLFIIDILLNYNTHNHITSLNLTKNDNFEHISKELDFRRLSYSHFKTNNIGLDLLMFSQSSAMTMNIDNQEYELLLFTFACSFFFNVLIRSKDRHYVAQGVDILKALINKDCQHANWLLDEFSNIEVINEYLVECPIIENRKIIVGILYACMIKLYKNDNLTVSNKLKLFFGNILHFILKYKDNGDKDLTYVYCNLYRFSCLGDNSKKFMIEFGLLKFLMVYYLNKTDNFEDYIELFIESRAAVNVDYSQPEHSFLSERRMTRGEKLSSSEENAEKKHAEKLLLARHDSFLLTTFCHLMSISTDPNLPLEDKSLHCYLILTNSSLIQVLLTEAKCKSSAISLAQLMQKACFNKSETSNAFQTALLNIISSQDSTELEYVMIVFKRFLAKIDDDFKDVRFKNTLIKYLNILKENVKYYAYMEFNIDFVINFSQKYQELLNLHIELLQEGFHSLRKFLKENPIPPRMTPSKTLVMYKSASFSYPTKVSSNALKSFEEKSNALTKERREKLMSIIKKNIASIPGYDSDLDLTDFKFSVKDKVKYDGLTANVISTLDEMIYIEYDKNQSLGKKRSPTQWVDTDSKLLHLIELYDDAEMEVEGEETKI